MQGRRIRLEVGMHRSTSPKPKRRCLWILVVLLLGWPVGFGAHASELGECYIAEMPSGFAFDTDRVHERGTLKVCVTERFTPGQTLHATFLNGRPIGRLMSRTVDAEGIPEGDEPYFVFDAMPSGNLTLLALVVADGDRLEVFRFRNGDRQQVIAACRVTNDEECWTEIHSKR